MTKAAWEQSTCAVPMWSGTGSPAGFCGNEAFGPQLPERFYNPNFGRRDAWSGQLIDKWAYCPGHACPIHNGPEKGQPIIFQDGTGEDGKPMYCAVMPGFVNLQESPAAFNQDPRKAVKDLARVIAEAQKMMKGKE